MGDGMLHNNTNTVIVNQPPTKFLPLRPPPTATIHNVYELKTQPELVRYYHVAAGFPSKPTWVKAIRNKQFASWPGLTVDAVKHHYPDSKETPKGHGRKTTDTRGQQHGLWQQCQHHTMPNQGRAYHLHMHRGHGG